MNYPEEHEDTSARVATMPVGHHPTLYDKIGGESSIKAAVELFYEKVLGDAALAAFFRNTNLDSLKRHQALFLSQALGGPKHYEGRDMFRAHKHLLIDEASFLRVVGHLQATLEELGVEAEDIQTVLGALAPLKRDIVQDHFSRWLRGG